MPLLQKIGGDIRIGGKSYFNGWNNLHGVLNGEIILGIHEGLVYVYHDANVTGLQIALHATRSPVTVDEFLEYLSTIAF